MLSSNADRYMKREDMPDRRNKTMRPDERGKMMAGQHITLYTRIIMKSMNLNLRNPNACSKVLIHPSRRSSVHTLSLRAQKSSPKPDMVGQVLLAAEVRAAALAGEQVLPARKAAERRRASRCTSASGSRGRGVGVTRGRSVSRGGTASRGGGAARRAAGTSALGLGDDELGSLFGHAVAVKRWNVSGSLCASCWVIAKTYLV